MEVWHLAIQTNSNLTLMKKKPCKRCGSALKHSRHHIYPTRWNRNRATEFHKAIRDEVIPLCRPCHDRIENIILCLEKEFKRMPEMVYLTLANNF